MQVEFLASNNNNGLNTCTYCNISFIAYIILLIYLFSIVKDNTLQKLTFKVWIMCHVANDKHIFVYALIKKIYILSLFIYNTVFSLMHTSKKIGK